MQKAISRLLELALLVVGLGGVPDAAKQWGTWLGDIDDDCARWAFVVIAVVLFVSTERRWGSFDALPGTSRLRQRWRLATARWRVAHEPISVREAAEYLRGDLPSDFTVVDSTAFWIDAMRMLEDASARSRITIWGQELGSQEYVALDPLCWKQAQIDLLDILDPAGDGGRTAARAPGGFQEMRRLQVYRDDVESLWERGDALQFRAERLASEGKAE